MPQQVPQSALFHDFLWLASKARGSEQSHSAFALILVAQHTGYGPFRQLLLLSWLDATRIGETSALLKSMLALVDRD